MTRSRTLVAVTLAAALGIAAAHANERHELLREHQQDALDLELKHNTLRSQGAGLGTADRIEIDRLRAQQRIEQQRLELDQLQRQRGLERTAPSLGDDETRRRLYLQQDAFRTERQLQSQRFYLEQQRFMQSTTPPPLQPAPLPGALRAR